MFSHQSSSDSPTCCCRLERFQLGSSQIKCCRYWRQGLSDYHGQTTGPSPICWQFLRSWRGWCRHICNLTWWALQSSASFSLPADKVTALRPLCNHQCSTAWCAFQTDCHWQTVIQLCCTNNLELSACFCR